MSGISRKLHEIARKRVLPALVGALLGAAVLPAASPNIDVNGLGLVRDFAAERAMLTFAAEEREAGEFSPATVEDGVVLLRSRLRENGFLEPEIELSVWRGADAEAETSLLEGNALPDLPRDATFRTIRYDVRKGIRFFYNSVAFDGLRILETKRAKSFFFPQSNLFNLRGARPYSPEIQQSGIRNLREAFFAKGYRSANIQTVDTEIDPETGRVDVRVAVDPGEPHLAARIHERIDGAGSKHANSLLRERSFEPEPFTPKFQGEAISDTRLRYFRAGYPDAKVSLDRESPVLTRPTAEDGGLVLLRVEPGNRVMLGGVTFSGLEQTEVGIARRQLTLEPGSWVSREALESTRRRLGDLGVFQSVRSRLEAPTGMGGAAPSAELPPGTVLRDVRFLLEEKTRRDYFLRGGYGSYEKLRLGLEVRQNNLFGKAHRSRFEGRYSMKSRNLEWVYSIPQWWGTPLRWSASVDWLAREEVSFERRETRFETGVDWVLPKLDTRLRLNYNLEDLESRDFAGSLRAGDPASRNGSVEFSALRDARDNPILPREGLRLRFNAEWSDPSLASDTRFQRLEFDAAYHWQPAAGWNLHFAFSHGVVFALDRPDRDVPVNKRFFPGGENDVRGYREGEASFRDENGVFIGSSHIWIANLEVERVLIGELLLVAFYDGLLHGRDEADYPGDTYLSSAGLGLRYNTFLGPLRLEYGHNLDRRPGDPAGTLHFSLGFPF